MHAPWPQQSLANSRSNQAIPAELGCLIWKETLPEKPVVRESAATLPEGRFKHSVSFGECVAVVDRQSWIGAASHGQNAGRPRW